MLADRQHSRKLSMDAGSSEPFAGTTPSGSRKRTRATPEQLVVLEATFERTPGPNQKEREALSIRLGMNERSVQIWFQNRRAKMKLMAKRAQQEGSSPTSAAFPSRMKRGSFSGPFGVNGGIPEEGHLQRTRTRTASISDSSPNFSMVGPPNAVVNGQISLSADSLSIGSWRRVALTNNDLVTTISLAESMVRWQIVEGLNSFKLEFPTSTLLKIELCRNPENPSQGHMTVELFQAPLFYMSVNTAAGSGGSAACWTQCQDFTESRQATSLLTHKMTGSMDCLSKELLALMASDARISQICTINDSSLGMSVASPSVGMTSSAAASPGIPSSLFSTRGLSFGSVNMMSRRESAPASVMFGGGLGSYGGASKGNYGGGGGGYEAPPSGMMIHRGSLLESVASSVNNSPIGSPMPTPPLNPLGMDLGRINEVVYPGGDASFTTSFDDLLQMKSVLEGSKSTQSNCGVVASPVTPWTPGTGFEGLSPPRTSGVSSGCSAAESSPQSSLSMGVDGQRIVDDTTTPAISDSNFLMSISDFLSEENVPAAKENMSILSL